MSREDRKIDDILRELDAEGKKGVSSSSPEIDALVQDLIEERLQPGIDPSSGQELPTRVFLRPKKHRPPPLPVDEGTLSGLLGKLAESPDTAPAEPAEKPPAETPPKMPPSFSEAAAHEPVKHSVSGTSVFASVPKGTPPPGIERPVPQKPPEPAPSSVQETPSAPPPPVKKTEPERSSMDAGITYTTGPISIDIDAIRAGAPPPRPIPAQKLSDEKDELEEGLADLPADPRRETRPPRPPQKVELDHIAPCFRRVVAEQGRDPARPDKIFRQIVSAAAVRSWILLLLFVFSLVLAFLMGRSRGEAAGWIPSRILMGIMTAISAGAGIAAWPAVGGGLLSLCKLEKNRDTLPAFCWLTTFCQAVTLTIWPRGFIHPQIQCYLPLGILALCLAYLGKLLVGNAGLRNWRFLRTDKARYVPQLVEDKRLAAELTRGLPDEEELPVANRKCAAITDLAEMSLQSDSSDRLGRLFTLIGLAAGVAAALTGFFLTKQKHFAVTLFTAVFSIFTPATAAVYTAYPLSRAAKQLEKAGGIVCGEQSGERFREVGSVLMDAQSLIPAGSVNLVAIKTFEGTRLDEILVDAASVLHSVGSVLTELFSKVTGKEKSMLRKADSVEIEDGKGVAGWIDGKRILIGSRAMMLSYDIRVPGKEYERRLTMKGHDVVYLASAGELAAIFVLTIRPARQAAEAAQSLTDSGIGIILSSVDSVFTPERLGRLFSVNPALVKILPRRLMPNVERLSSEVLAKRALVANDGSPKGLAASLTAAKRLRAMISLNRVMTLTSALLGVVLLMIFWILGGLPYLTPVLLTGYALVWPLLSWALQKILH